MAFDSEKQRAIMGQFATGVTVVTAPGASSGIGAAIARAAISAGAQVAVSARRENLLNALVADAGGGHVVAGDASLAKGVVGKAMAAGARVHRSLLTCPINQSSTAVLSTRSASGILWS